MSGTGPACLIPAHKSSYEFVHDYEHPVPKSHEVLIRIEAVGLNPIDWKSNVYGFAIYSFPWINGRECAGRVIGMGNQVNNQRLKIGDRVFVASSNYRDIRTSSFQEYCVALAENCGRIPNWMSFEEAAGLGVALIAGAAALYDCLDIPRQPSATQNTGPDEWLLIWASASSAGIVLTQLAKAAGLKVIGVSSKANFDYARSRGVDITLDRQDPETVVRVARSLGVKYAVDCVGPETAAFAVQALRSGGTLVALVKAPKTIPDEVKVEQVLIKRFHEDAPWGEELMRFSEELLAQKRLQPPRVRVLAHGLAGVPDGLQLLQDDAVSGHKLVVRVRDTPKDTKRRADLRPTTPASRPATPTQILLRQQKIVA